MAAAPRRRPVPLGPPGLASAGLRRLLVAVRLQGLLARGASRARRLRRALQGCPADWPAPAGLWGPDLADFFQPLAMREQTVFSVYQSIGLQSVRYSHTHVCVCVCVAIRASARSARPCPGRVAAWVGACAACHLKTTAVGTGSSTNHIHSHGKHGQGSICASGRRPGIYRAPPVAAPGPEVAGSPDWGPGRSET